MPLSKHRQRRLGRIEQALFSPDLRVGMLQRRMLKQAFIGLVVGYVMLSIRALAELGVGLMVSSCVWGVMAFLGGRGRQRGLSNQVPAATSTVPSQHPDPVKESRAEYARAKDQPRAAIDARTLEGAGEHSQAETLDRQPVNEIGSEEALLAAIDESLKYYHVGDFVEGTVVKVDRDEILVNLGYKTVGVIPSRELSVKHGVSPHEVVTVGEHIEALVLHLNRGGRLILSKKRAEYERAWDTLQKIKDEDGVVTGTVVQVVKGGLIVDVVLRGFLPASLIETRRVRDLWQYAGKEIEAKVIELDKDRNNLVLSRRAWLEQTQPEVGASPARPSATSVQPPANMVPGQNEHVPEPADIVELLSCWDEAIRHAPDPDDPIRFLAQRTGVGKSQIYRLRNVRNRCAHPYEEGWPRMGEFDDALAAARELRRRLSSSS